jgi:flagellar biosynthetic protein FliP
MSALSGLLKALGLLLALSLAGAADAQAHDAAYLDDPIATAVSIPTAVTSPPQAKKPVVLERGPLVTDQTLSLNNVFPVAANTKNPILLPSIPDRARLRRQPVRSKSEPGAKAMTPNAQTEPVSATSQPVRTVLLLTLLAVIPAMAICVTPFIRIVVVLSMIRHAFGMPETPPNQVLVSLSLFLTMFVMMSTLMTINTNAIQPFLNGTIPVKEAFARGEGPIRAFMLRQVHDKDIKTVYDISRQPLPTKAENVGTMQLATAFMLNELRVSFKIGFVILLPFLLIDLVVSSILLSLGMLMVPPSTISLPIKVLMFVLVDGWSLILEGVVGSFK